MLKYKDPTPSSLWICYSTLSKFFFNFPTMLRLILTGSLLWNMINSVGGWLNEWMNEWSSWVSSFISHQNTYLWLRLCQSDILIELIYFDVEKVMWTKPGREHNICYDYFMRSVAVMEFLLGKERVPLEPEAAVAISWNFLVIGEAAVLQQTNSYTKP